jgi:hypothetical protein
MDEVDHLFEQHEALLRLAQAQGLDVIAGLLTGAA